MCKHKIKKNNDKITKAWESSPQAAEYSASANAGGKATGETFDAVSLSRRCWMIKISTKIVV